MEPITVEEMVGYNVRRLRESQRLTQTELGELLGKSLGKPWSRQAMSAAEKGDRDWRAVELVAVAKALDTSVGYLMFPTGIHESIRLPAISIDAEEVIGIQVGGETPRWLTAWESVRLLHEQIVETQRQLAKASSELEDARKTQRVVAAMFRQEMKAETGTEQ